MRAVGVAQCAVSDADVVIEAENVNQRLGPNLMQVISSGYSTNVGTRIFVLELPARELLVSRLSGQGSAQLTPGAAHGAIRRPLLCSVSSLRFLELMKLCDGRQCSAYQCRST